MTDEIKTTICQLSNNFFPFDIIIVQILFICFFEKKFHQMAHSTFWIFYWGIIRSFIENFDIYDTIKFMVSIQIEWIFFCHVFLKKTHSQKLEEKFNCIISNLSSVDIFYDKTRFVELCSIHGDLYLHIV